MTLEKALVHYDGYYTEEEIRAGFAAHDVNDNGFWCYRITPPDWRYYPLVHFFLGNEDDLADVSPH